MPYTNPFADLDFSKLLNDFKVPGVDLDSLVATQRKNIEAVTAANQLAFEGMQAVARRQMEILKETMDEANSVMRQAMTQGAPEDKMSKQAELSKAAFEKALANMRELAEMVAKANREAAEVISKRVTASIDELKQVMAKK